MKKILSVLITVISFLILFSCKKDDLRISNCPICGQWRADSAIIYNGPYPSTSVNLVNRNISYETFNEIYWSESDKDTFEIVSLSKDSIIMYEGDIAFDSTKLSRYKYTIDGNYLFLDGNGYLGNRHQYFLSK
jgi:hypothetical protein